MTTTETATLRTTGLTIDYTDKDGDQQSITINIGDGGHITIEDAVGDEACILGPPREAALAIADAFKRLAQELPEAPTDV